MALNLSCADAIKAGWRRRLQGEEPHDFPLCPPPNDRLLNTLMYPVARMSGYQVCVGGPALVYICVYRELLVLDNIADILSLRRSCVRAGGLGTVGTVYS